MKKIENDLGKIYKSLGKMTALVDEAISNTILALRNRDLELANQVISNDENINAMEIKIDHDCIIFIASNQPVASDLRVIASVHKIITDLERIGDGASDICKYLVTVSKKEVNPIDEMLSLMAEDVRKMVNKAIQSFTNRKLSLAKEVIELDNLIDKHYHKIKNTAIKEMDGDLTTDNKLLVNQILIAKYFEKIGDHAQNIAEWIIFNVSGEYQL